jgi:hypothetical protein
MCKHWKCQKVTQSKVWTGVWEFYRCFIYTSIITCVVCCLFVVWKQKSFFFQNCNFIFLNNIPLNSFKYICIVIIPVLHQFAFISIHIFDSSAWSPTLSQPFVAPPLLHYRTHSVTSVFLHPASELYTEFCHTSLVYKIFCSTNAKQFSYKSLYKHIIWKHT